MRQVINPQLQFGEQDIGAIELDPKSRDDIPQLLRGLQHIYTTPALRARVFAILAEVIPAGVHGQADANTGRPATVHVRTAPARRQPLSGNGIGCGSFGTTVSERETTS